MGAWVREVYSDGSAFKYSTSDSYSAAGAIVGPVIGAPQLIDEDGTQLWLSLLTVTCSAKLQVSRSSRSQIETGGAFWEDVTSLTGLGASAVARAVAWNEVRAYRLYVSATGAGGGSATIHALAIPSRNLSGKGTSVETVSPIGGICEIYVNGGSGASVKGEILEQDAAVDYEVTPCPTSSQACKCYTYSSGLPVGAYMLVVRDGHAEALLENGVAAALGEIVLVSTAAAGRVTTSAPPGAVASHFREGGHVLAARVGGVNVLVPVEIHWL